MVTVTMDAKQPVVTVQEVPPPHPQTGRPQTGQDAAPRGVTRPVASTSPSGTVSVTTENEQTIIDVG